MEKTPLLWLGPWLLIAVLITACGQHGALILPGGKTPTPAAADQVGEPSEDDTEKKAKPDGG